MNGRVLLLVVVTGLFMTAWDGDQTAMQAAIAKREQQSAARFVQTTPHTKTTQAVANRHQLTNLPRAADTSETTETLNVAITQNEAAADVPLPQTIAAGQYRAVHQTGRTVMLTVTPQQANSELSRDFYLVDAASGERWYLIRVTQ